MNDVLVPAVVFLSICAIVKIITDYRLRRRLIDKEMVNENIKYLYPKDPVVQPLSSVKWGTVLIGIGLALLSHALFPESISEQATFGLVFVLAGIGFLVYYFVARRQIERMKEKDTDKQS